MKRQHLIHTLTALLLGVGCVTVNVYFPAAEIRELSRQIEEAVQEEAAMDADSSAWLPPAAEQSLVARLLTSNWVWAQDSVAAPEVTNPAIRAIIDSRAQRLAEIGRFKSSGAIGENRQALLEIRNLDAVSDLRERATVQRLVRDENEDRQRLFREIAAAKNVDLSQLPRIQETYAETLRQNARPGDWIQGTGGDWRQK